MGVCVCGRPAKYVPSYVGVVDAAVTAPVIGGVRRRRRRISWPRLGPLLRPARAHSSPAARVAERLDEHFPLPLCGLLKLRAFPAAQLTFASYFTLALFLLLAESGLELRPLVAELHALVQEALHLVLGLFLRCLERGRERANAPNDLRDMRRLVCANEVSECHNERRRHRCTVLAPVTVSSTGLPAHTPEPNRAQGRVRVPDCA